MDKTTTAPAVTAAGKATWVTGLKAGAFLLVTIQLAAAVYGFFWGLFSYQKLEQMLGLWRVTDYSAALDQVLNLSFAPLTYALLFVLAPLVGWWIYSRVETARQTAVGWSTVGFFLLGNALILALSGEIGFIVLLFGSAILGFYTMFWMGIGFNLAKLFRIKL